MAVSEARMRELLGPYLGDWSLDAALLAQLDRYLDLILLWNARTNLTAVREPEAILTRQIGESLFAARFLAEAGSLLDFGSGAGFPGVPIALSRPGVQVTLAESQGKKASFLREVARSLNIPLTVWAARVETLPAEKVFGCVTMRAVDDSERMLALAMARVAPSGRLLRYLGEGLPVEIPEWNAVVFEPIPNSKGMLQILVRA